MKRLFTMLFRHARPMVVNILPKKNYNDNTIYPAIGFRGYRNYYYSVKNLELYIAISFQSRTGKNIF